MKLQHFKKEMKTTSYRTVKIFTVNTSDKRLISEIYGKIRQLRHNSPMEKNE